MDRPSAADAVTLELARVAARLRHAWRAERGALRFVAAPAEGDGVEAEFARLALLAGRLEDPDPEIGALAESADALERRCVELRGLAPELPLYRLVGRAGLDAVGRDLLLLALGPEVEGGFGRAFGLLGGAARALDVGTAIRLCSPGDPSGQAIRRALATSGALVGLGLIVLRDPQRAGGLGATLVAPAPVVAAVLGLPIEDGALAGLAAIAGPPPVRLPVAAELVARLAELLANPSALSVLEGPAGYERRALARAAAAHGGRRLVEVELDRALEPDEIAGVVRLAWLEDAALALELPPADPTGASASALLGSAAALVARAPGPVIVSRFDGGPSPTLPTDRHAALLAVPLADAVARASIWRGALGDALGTLDADELGQRYTMSAGDIEQAARTARLRLVGRGGRALGPADVVDAIDLLHAGRLGRVGRRLRQPAVLADLVLPTDARETLEELEATVRLRFQVLEQWRFGKLVRGRGVSALFYGEPGTGKTMAASAIASACGLALYQIDTAQVVSKWIGETEKNLAEVFRAAEASHALLLFDEADAVFGKRTEVKGSTDRYANLQTNFLLTQLETFNGVSILTTNRDSAMDVAFMRRLSFRVLFPMPEVDEREALWRRCLAVHDPALAAALELAPLARRLVMSGGYIRNAVLRGAYLAAQRRAPITTELLHHAAELVLRDAGKVV